MKNQAVFPGKYIQGQGVLHELPEIVNSIANKALLLASPSVHEKVLPVFGSPTLNDHISVAHFGGECCENELEKVGQIISKDKIDVLVGMGGGKTIDTAKIVADRAGIPVIIVPTIASSDAPCSGVAVVYSPDGIYQGAYQQKSNPEVVLVDLDIIAHAPPRFLVAGMGDALSTWFEARSCHQTQSLNECGGLSTLAGLNLARLCYDTLLEYGVYAKLANEKAIVTPAFNYIVEANILLSGIGFESGGLATAHSVHNGLTSLVETHPYYHGEKVAFGVLTGLHLNLALPEEIETVYSFCEHVGLPTTLADIGIIGSENSSLMRVAQKACSPEQFIHHEAIEITPGKVVDAMIMADMLGRTRKARLVVP